MGGSKLGIVPRVLGVSGVVTSVWRCWESAGHIGDNWKVAGKWGILLQVSINLEGVCRLYVADMTKLPYFYFPLLISYVACVLLSI